MGICNVKADNNVVLSNKAYLLKTGMPQKEIEKLDDDVMQFIVDDLKSGGKHFEYINSLEILYLIFDYPHKHYTFKYFEV